MKVVRTVILICAFIGSFALPICLLTIQHFHLEDQAAEWVVSMWPQSQWAVALEDRRAMADMLVRYGELAGQSMLASTVFGWCAIFVFARIFRRAPARGDSAN
jgi:ABC-type spermidine/putrescine transport system permease subunit II